MLARSKKKSFYMTEVTEENLTHLAKLCRIRCSDKERNALLKDFRQIVDYVEQLSKIDTEGVAPCSCVTRGHTQTPRRDDICENTLDRELFLKGAPSFIAGLVRVPTILKSKEGKEF
jgi:aspartyl-tRNA(Asn)/glutamyl-tRNA(Gln) amidotransferase subunit C